jgi:L-asparaginase II
MQFKALEVEVMRGSQVESRHIVNAVVFHRGEAQSDSYGDWGLPVFPRSSLKPIQALPLILTGAARHFEVTMAELALSCASHRGEAIHTEPINLWLGRLGLSENALECGVHPPSNQESLYNLLGDKKAPSAIHNNCSGKHTGMLTTALFMSEPTKNYVSLSHPVQQRLKKYIELFCGFELASESFGVDGCSIPAPCIPLKSLAQVFCEFAAPMHATKSILRVDEASACKTLFEACVTYPLLTSGHGSYYSEMMIQCNGKVLIKAGAEGVVTVAIPSLQIGIAIKAIDGNSRASEFCTSILLHRLGLLDAESPFLKPDITNWNMISTGYLRLRN